MSSLTIPARGPTPVVFNVFNRPRHTERTFAAIRAYRPSRLFVVADGPRPDRPADNRLCEEVRAIVSRIDWPCDASFDFFQENLGCAPRVAGGVDRAFESVDRAIMLEDDCLASPEFFSFCDTLLERYEDTSEVWVINGNSYQPEFQRGDGSYYFSKYPDSWGWATWRRAWRHYRHDLPFLEAWLASPDWKAYIPNAAERRYLEHVFRLALSGKVDSRAYRWTACVMHGHGLCATPNANLVANIGFDDDATHTRRTVLAYEVTPLGPLRHPSAIRVDDEADALFRERFRFERGFPRIVADWIRQRIRKPAESPR